MERTYIQWNLPNWITIFLMAVLGYAVFSTVISYGAGLVRRDV